MGYVVDVLMYMGLFAIIKTIQMIASFTYTTYKSLTIHNSWAHAFFPPLRDRLRYGSRATCSISRPVFSSRCPPIKSGH